MCHGNVRLALGCRIPRRRGLFRLQRESSRYRRSGQPRTARETEETLRWHCSALPTAARMAAHLDLASRQPSCSCAPDDSLFSTERQTEAPDSTSPQAMEGWAWNPWWLSSHLSKAACLDTREHVYTSRWLSRMPNMPSGHQKEMAREEETQANSLTDSQKEPAEHAQRSSKGTWNSLARQRLLP